MPGISPQEPGGRSARICAIPEEFLTMVVVEKLVCAGGQGCTGRGKAAGDG